MRVRLDWNVLSLAAGETTKMMWRMSRPYLPSLVLGLAIIAVLYALALRFLQRLWKTAPEQGTVSPNGRSFAYAAIACVLLGMAGEHIRARRQSRRANGRSSLRRRVRFSNAPSRPPMDRADFCKRSRTLGLADMVAPAAVRALARAARPERHRHFPGIHLQQTPVAVRQQRGHAAVVRRNTRTGWNCSPISFRCSPAPSTRALRLSPACIPWRISTPSPPSAFR